MEENHYSENNFQRLLQEIKIKTKKNADIHNEREDYMLSQLLPKVEEILKNRPDLANKKDLKILMFLGAVHTRISHLMTKFGQKNTRTFSRPIMRYSFQDEAHRRFALGKEVDNELASKILLEGLASNLIGQIAQNFTSDNDKISAFIRKIVSSFTFEEIRELYAMSLPEAVKQFITYLGNKGINPPKNLSDLEKFISVK